MRRFMDLAVHTSSWSKDPRRKVGCVIVSHSNNVLSGGYNGFPRGIADDHRLEDHSIKNSLVVHAEVNAIAAAARHGHALLDTTAFVTERLCSRCAGVFIQAGITKVVYKIDNAFVPSATTLEDFKLAAAMLEEACVQLICINEDTNGTI